jgi:hypothetical protein
MALINCPECGREVSDTASVCIHCGFKLKEEAEFASPIQQVEISSINLKSKKLKKLIVFLIVIAILAVTGTFTYKYFENKKINEAKEDYQSVMSTFQLEVISGAAGAETVCNLTHSVWSNCIYEKDDPETDKYTKSYDSIFYSDFNTALSNLYADESFIEKIDSIKKNQETVKNTYKILKDYPDGYNEYYDICSEVYSLYKDFTALAVSPSGNLKSYTENFNTLDTDFMSAYNDLTEAIEDFE